MFKKMTRNPKIAGHFLVMEFLLFTYKEFIKIFVY